MSIGLLLLFSSFQNEVSEKDRRKQLIDAEIKKRLNDYRITEIANCQKRALNEASAIVDSILIANAINVRADNTVKPPKPDKPEKPEILQAKDSLPVEPLFDN